jgi:hypothetical protein
MCTGHNLICSNVGDSRAILASLRDKNEVQSLIDSKKNKEEGNEDGEEEGGQNLDDSNNLQIESIAGPSHEANKVWVATALSRDHKPNLTDELERILGCNGRVDTFRGKLILLISRTKW